MLNEMESRPLLTIALPKGRLQQSCLDLLVAAGLDCQSIVDSSRSLLFRSDDGQFCFLLARPADIPNFVEQGVADVGLIGRDLLLEVQPDVNELLDLGVGRCRLMLAGPARFAERPLASADFPLRVATKFPRIAEQFFQERQWPVELVRLHGAIELAPNIGVADLIADIVSTGKTLAANGLVAIEEMFTSSVRLIANRESCVRKRPQVEQLMDCLRPVVSLGGDN